MTAIDDIHVRHYTYRAGKLRRILWWLSGAQRDALEHPLSAGNRVFYDALGATVGLTAVADGLIGGANARAFLFHGSFLGGLAAAIVWGGAILTLDRMLLAGMDALYEAGSGRRITIGTFRICAAAIIATANAVPAECLLFRGRLDVQIAENQTAEMAHDNALLAEAFKDLANVAARRDALRKEDADANSRADDAAQQMIAENDGSGGTGIPGDGARHREKQAEFERLRSRAAQLHDENSPKIRDLDNQIAGREKQYAREQAFVQGLVARSDDPLARIEALADLKADPKHGPHAVAAGWLITFISLLFGVGPVLAKLLRSRSEYDALLAARRDSARAHWRARTEMASGEAAAEVDIARARSAAKVAVAEQMAGTAVNAAINSPGAARRRRTMAHEILKAAVPAAHEAIRDAFSAEAMAAEVRTAAEAARRQQAETIIRTEKRRQAAFETFDQAESLAQTLHRNPEYDEHGPH